MNNSDLRFLADESCDFAVVRALRAEGYDVLAVSEIMHRSDDRELIELARREKRILLTEDKDFGWLVFVSHAGSAGVIDSLPRQRPSDFGSNRQATRAGTRQATIRCLCSRAAWPYSYQSHARG